MRKLGKKKTFFVCIIVFVGIILFLFTLHLFLERNMGNSQTITKDNFTLTYIYRGDGTWDYTIAGTLPTPCYSVTTDATVMESDPEQVQIKIKVQEQPTEGVCSTVIQEYSYDGTFNASKSATISLVVE